MTPRRRADDDPPSLAEQRPPTPRRGAPTPESEAPERPAGSDPTAPPPRRGASPPETPGPSASVVTAGSPRHAPLRRGLEARPAHASERPATGSPRHAVAEASVPSALHPSHAVPARPARRLRLAYQVGVPVLGVASLMAVQAFTPAPSADAREDVVRVPATAATSGTSTATALGANANGSLSIGGSRIPTSRNRTRPVIRPADAPENLGVADCPVGGSKHATCNQAIAFMVKQMRTQSYAWHDQCLALVGTAYGGIFQRVPRAIDGAMLVKSAGKLHRTDDYRSIPRGSLLWFASAPGQPNQAGHVAVAVGGGMAISNDAPFDDGRVGVVPISYFTTQWGKIFLGYSNPADSRNA
ncbi:MAG TPA: hypothetical protein VHO26_06025 [Propionibacteriaceae bacterium]|nr:hypothetical protein [Propionibacteriaceae bacterium]